MISNFLLPHYQRHNRRRQEHLATLGLPLEGRTVLEVGAGVGDHTEFFLDRGCTVTSTDAREDLVEHMRERFPGRSIALYDANEAPPAEIEPHEIVYSYGLLYHLREPERALEAFARLSTDLLLLETCVSFGAEEAMNPVGETIGDATQATDGLGCRPTRPWLWSALGRLFAHVYVPATQPYHEEFPVDWTDPSTARADLSRAVFVASHRPLRDPRLLPSLPDRQIRC